MEGAKVHSGAPAARASKHGRRGRAAHLGPERRRPLVLDAAFELLLEHGYEGTSMDAIAAAAGVTKPVVYACFPSKEELFKALMQREEARVLTEVQEALPAASDLDDVERTLIDGLTAFLRAVAASPRAYRVVFLGEGGVNAAVAGRIRRGREMQVEAVADLARRWLEERKHGAELEAIAGLLGEVVVSLAEAGARTLLSDPERWSPEQLGEMLGRLAAAGQTQF
jgi:AcrR family transcriptional regulator